MKRTGNLYHKIIEWDNLLLAFYKAAKGKHTKAEVILYEKNLNENLKNLQKNLIKQVKKLDCIKK